MALYYQFHQMPQKQAVVQTIKKLNEIKLWFEKQKTYHFYASSLLVVYEADVENDANNNNNNSNSPNDNNSSKLDFVRVVLADFAHVYPANGSLDENFLFGLKKLIDSLSLLLSPNYKFKETRSII